MKKLLLGLAILAVVFTTSCATGQGKIKFPYDSDHLEKGEYTEARELLSTQRSNKFSEYNLNNEISYYLDRGMLAYYAGDHAVSNEDLLEAERLMEEAFTKSVTERVKRVSKNDPYKIEYVGEDYENIYLNVFTALNFYQQGNIESAQVEIRKMNDKMKFVVNTYEEWLASIAPDWRQQTAGSPTYYYKSALAGYLGMLFWRADGNEDSARIDAQSISDAFKEMPEVYSHPLPRELVMRGNVNDELSIPAGMARLNFIAFTGLSPLKTGYNRGPSLIVRRSEADRIQIVFDNGNRMNLSLLEPISNVVYQIARTREFYRTTGEELLRKAGTLKEGMEFFGNVGINAALSLFMPLLVTKIAVEMIAESSNKAKGEYDTMDRTVDRRMGRFIPGRAWVGGINLRPGEYSFTINYYKGNQIINSRRIENYHAEAGKLNLVNDHYLKHETISDNLYWVFDNDTGIFFTPTGGYTVPGPNDPRAKPLPDYPGRLPAPNVTLSNIERREDYQYIDGNWRGTGTYYMQADITWDPVPGAIMYYVFEYTLLERTMGTSIRGSDFGYGIYKIIAFGNEGYGQIRTVNMKEMLNQ
ncbi:MAG: hypothetical protein FWD36_00115 [Treponema sp.]|nr:hypothetical protein [Treponema sp.]